MVVQRKKGVKLLAVSSRVIVFIPVWSHPQLSVVPGVITGRNNEQS